MRYHFTGTLTPDDMHRHIPHEFTVAENAQQISIRMDHSPEWADGAVVPHEISLSLFAPDGARGARHCNPDQSLTISAHGATPGYIPGPLTRGTWTVYIDTHRIMPPGSISYTITVHVSAEPTNFSTPRYTPGRVASRGPGWYRGDLHAHTLHSDADWDVPDMIAEARQCSLDFVTLTDHNTVSGLAESDSLAGDDLLTLGGIELTTFYGHCLALGTRQWQEWRIRDDFTIADIAEAVRQADALFVIAHPASIGYPFCSGCAWEYADMMPGSAAAVEIWNGDWAGDSGNAEALNLYYTWLNAGHQLVATAGRDIHGPQADGERPGYNIVYADDLSETDVLAAIRRGHLYLSSGPHLSFTATGSSGHTAMMGDVVDDVSLELSVRWDDCQADHNVRLVCNGDVLETLLADGSGEKTWPVKPDGVPSWYIVEIRTPDDQLHAITNPIFVGDWS